jgi:hypothetical protein
LKKATSSAILTIQKTIAAEECRLDGEVEATYVLLSMRSLLRWNHERLSLSRQFLMRA